MTSRGTLRLAAGALLLGLCQGAAGQAAETLKVGVIDQQAVMEQTKAGKRAIGALKAFSTTRQRIISTDDVELKKLEQELTAQDGGLSESAKQEKQEQFRAKFESYQRRVQEFNREVQAKQKEVAEEFQKKIAQAAAAVAKKAGYAVVLEKGSDATMKIVLYQRDAIDLTDEVAKEFDRRHK